MDVYTSIGEIQGALARHGATKIMIDYDNGKPQAIAFGIDTPVGPRGFRLPADRWTRKSRCIRSRATTGKLWLLHM